MAKVVQSSRDLARPVVEALKAAFSLDDYLVHIERRNAADDVAVWYPVSILSHPELVRLMEIAETTRAKIAILPDEGSKMKVELRVSGRG
ncbi:MAG TPA: hypothetical protein VF950_11950 [Planctomycetota bacterium]